MGDLSADPTTRPLKVAIDIITRDRPDILPRAIESALGQDYPFKVVRVLDDASEVSLAGLADRFGNVHWERSGTRMGIPAARNRLMASSVVDLVVGLDDDAWFLEEDAISVAVRAMDADPRIGALAFDVLSQGRSVQHRRSGPRPWHAFQGCGHMLRMTALRDVGMYSLVPGWYGAEEKDLCLRLLDAGFEVALLPGVHVWHDKTDVAREEGEQHASGVCNDVIFVTRRAPAPMLPWLLPLKVLSHLWFSLRRGLLRPCILGLWRFAGALPGAIASRAAVRWRVWREYGRRAKCGPRPLGPEQDGRSVRSFRR